MQLHYAEHLPSRVRALVLDQRGFGESERPASGYDVSDFAADVARFLDALAIERAIIVGHSFGSFVARAVAIDHPARVSRLALIGTGATAANAVTREMQASVQHLEDPVPLAFAREFQASTAYAPLPPDFFSRIIGESIKLPARLWREVFDRLLAYDDRERWPRITAPTLVLWGERDALFRRVDQDRFVAAVSGATFRMYPEVGHCPNWECPELVAADLGAFRQQA